MTKLMQWGESMYEGYYAEAFVDGKYTGFHADTLRELREKLAAVGINKLDKRYRWDN